MPTNEERQADEASESGDEAADLNPDSDSKPTPPAEEMLPPSPAAPAIPLYDLHTIARGVAECNMLMLQGWRVYGAWIVEEVRVRGGPQRAEVRQPMPYYFLGRLLIEEERATRSKIANEAAAVAADAVQPTPAPEPAAQSDPGPEAEVEVKPAPASRRSSRSRARKTKAPAIGSRRSKTVRPQGGAGAMETQGLRG